MSTPSDKLQAALDDLVASKTLSLDAAGYVERLKEQAKALGDSNMRLTQEAAKYERRINELIETNARLTGQVLQISEREAAVAKREVAITELEKARAVAVAESCVVQKCFDLVFRNIEVRNHVYGRVPAQTSVAPGAPGPSNSYGMPGFVPGNGDGTVTVDNTQAQSAR